MEGRRHRPGRSLGRSLLFAGLIIISLAACDLPFQVFVDPTPTPTPKPLPSAPPKTIVFCDDESGSYPPELFKSAAAKMAGWIDGLVGPAQLGATVYVQLINANSYSVDSTVLEFSIPLIEPLPADPTPLPTTGPLAVHESETRAAQVTETASAYTTNTSRITQFVKQTKEQTRKYTNKLRALPHVVAGSSDIWGCPQRATERLQAAPRNNKKYLVIASDMEIAGPQQKVAVQLSGVRVFIINFPCNDAAACASRKNYWMNALKQTGALVTFLDPGETNLKAQLFT